MASGISTATIAGNLTKDAELNETGRVLSFSVAVNRYEKQGDEAGERVHFFDCKVLGNRAASLAQYLTKGSKVTIHGDLVQDRWETDGQKRSAVRILARDVVLGGSGERKPSEDSTTADEDPGW